MGLKCRPVLHLKDMPLFLPNTPTKNSIYTIKKSSNPLINNAVIRMLQYLL